MENRVILAFPRSGSKLLSSIHKQHGYHDFGEFFNSFSTVILNTPVMQAVRMPIDQQRQIWETRKERGITVDDWTQSLIVKHRFKKFNQCSNITPSIVTIWFASIESSTEAFELLNNRTVLCLRRKNKFEQLLSRCITRIHLNHDNEFESVPLKIDIPYFDFSFNSLLKLEMLQDYYIDTGKGKLIDFDDLIAGNADLGFSYSVNSIDQHKNLENLVLNIDEVKERYQTLKKIYNITDDAN
jgi:hypothetical protein